MVKIREFREALSLTQEQLGKIVGVTQHALSNYESGKREAPYSVLLKLSDTLKVPINELLGETPDNVFVITKDQLDALTKNIEEADQTVKQIQKQHKEKTKIEINEFHGSINIGNSKNHKNG